MLSPYVVGTCSLVCVAAVRCTNPVSTVCASGMANTSSGTKVVGTVAIRIDTGIGLIGKARGVRASVSRWVRSRNAMSSMGSVSTVSTMSAVSAGG